MASIAVSNNPFAIGFLSDKLKDDYDIAIKAIKKEPTMYKHLSKRLKIEPEILKIINR